MHSSHDEPTTYSPHTIIVGEIATLLNRSKAMDRQEIKLRLHNVLQAIAKLWEFSNAKQEAANNILNYLSLSKPGDNEKLTTLITRYSNGFIVTHYLRILTVLLAAEVVTRKQVLSIHNSLLFKGSRDLVHAGRLDILFNFYNKFLDTKENAGQLLKKITNPGNKVMPMPQLVCEYYNEKLYEAFLVILHKLYNMRLPAKDLLKLFIYVNYYHSHEHTIHSAYEKTNILLEIREGGQPVKNYYHLFGAVLYRRLEELPEDKSLLEHKEMVRDYIFSMKNRNDKISALTNAIDKEKLVGRYFWTQRGEREPRLSGGVLNDLHQELVKLTSLSPAPQSRISAFLFSIFNHGRSETLRADPEHRENGLEMTTWNVRGNT